MNKQPQRPTAAIVTCRDYEPQNLRAQLRTALDLLGGIELFIRPGQSVLIKPNLIAPLPVENRATTDPQLILAMAEIVLDAGAKPFVADSTAWGTVADCMHVMGIADRLRQMGVPFMDLRRPRWTRIHPANTLIGISSLALDADRIINLPKLKAHQQLVATIAVKNSFGCVSGKAKPLLHFLRGGDETRFCQMLLGVHNAVAPCLNVVDAVIAMQGAGPMRGTPANIGAIVASADAYACETLCATLMNIPADGLPILRTAIELGLAPASLNEVHVLGTDPADLVMDDFQQAVPIPIKFTLSRVCRSVARQLSLLAGSWLRRAHNWIRSK